MPYDASHGPPMLDATHAWDPATATAPPTLGDSHTDTLILPRIVIDRITGWRNLPDLVDNRSPRTFGVGEKPYPPRQTGKTLVYEARLQADDRLELLAAQNALLIGFGDRDVEGVMTVTPWTLPGGVAWTYSALVLDLQFDPAWTLDGASRITYEWPFTLTLRMSDPHFYTGGTGYL